jgi:hypothetical protein
MAGIFNTLLTILLLTFVVMVNSIPVRDRFRYSDPNEQNRVSKHLNAVSSSPMQGGGWPSTTGNPSGGGRWN